MDATTAYEILKDLPLDSTLFVSYVAGRAPSAQALREGERAMNEGISPRHFTGTFKGVRKTKRTDEVVFTLWCEERDSVHRDGTVTNGAYRAFNPSLGRLLTLEVVKKA